MHLISSYHLARPTARHLLKRGLTPLVIAEGHRPGLNCRPSPETVAALHRVLIAVGVTHPKPKPPPAPKSGYGRARK